MYDIDTKNVKKSNRFYLAFLAFGIVFLIIMGGILVRNYLKFKNLDSEVLSTSVEVNSYYDNDGSVQYSPIYYYAVDGKGYTCSSNSSSSRYPGTENKIIYYDSKDPANSMSEYDKSSNGFLLVFMIIPLSFIFIAVFNMRKISKRVKLVNELNQRGKLVKNLRYRLENTGITVNDTPIQRPVVDYILPSGSTITLYGDPRYDKKSCDNDGMVDLVIDEHNPDNYFIDFEINRISGNLPSDYSDYSDYYN